MKMAMVPEGADTKEGGCDGVGERSCVTGLSEAVTAESQDGSANGGSVGPDAVTETATVDANENDGHANRVVSAHSDSASAISIGV